MELLFKFLELQKVTFKEVLWLVIGISLLIVGVINPYIAFVFCVISLVIFSISEEPKLNALLSWLALVFISLVASTRKKFVTISDDFTRYYDHFIDINIFDYTQLFAFGEGLEVALPMLHYLIKIIFGEVSPLILMFLHSFLISSLFFFIVKKYFINGVLVKYQGIIWAFIITFYPYFLSTQLIRQSYSVLIITIALFELKNKKHYILVLIAGAFHLSGIFLYILYRAAIQIWDYRSIRSTLYLILVSLMVIFSVNFLIENFELVSGITLRFELMNEVDPITISTLRYLLIALFVNIMFLLLDIVRNKKRVKRYNEVLAIILITLVIVFATFNLGYLPFRLALLFTFLFPVFIIANIKDYTQILLPLILVLIIWKLSVPIRSAGQFQLWSEVGFFDIYILKILGL